MNIIEPQVFEPMPKIPRLNRDIIVTEKIDGTNASIYIDEFYGVRAASRTRWITAQNDNFGFAQWVEQNNEALRVLGPGHHFGEWYGFGINRGYGLNCRRFALFNVSRWDQELFEINERINAERKKPNPAKTFVPPPACCSVVPVLYRGPFSQAAIIDCLHDLLIDGSAAVEGFMRPEGVVVYHEAARQLFKVTLENDAQPKSLL